MVETAEDADGSVVDGSEPEACLLHEGEKCGIGLGAGPIVLIKELIESIVNQTGGADAGWRRRSQPLAKHFGGRAAAIPRIAGRDCQISRDTKSKPWVG